MSRAVRTDVGEGLGRRYGATNLGVARRWRLLVLGGGAAVLLGATAACWKSNAVPDAPGLAEAIYAAPWGTTDGDGSKERPLDLATALSTKAAVRPGGTVWLRGGVYPVAGLTATIAGAEGRPITVRPVPGEPATIDGAAAAGSVLTVNGPWTVFRDFEITNSSPRRVGDDLQRGVGVDVHGANAKLINLVLHDLGGGIGMWSDAVDSEVYGNIVYYNGWRGSDRSHGHGIYTQNTTGTRRVTDNVIFGQFGAGIHAYASDEGFLDNIHLEGNVVANNGIPDGDFNILLGGHRRAERPVITSNYTFDSPGIGNNVGFAAGCAAAEIRDNYFAVVRGGYTLQLVNCSGRIEGNTFVGNARGIADGAIVTQAELAAQYSSNTFAGDRPGATKTIVRPNRYEPGRSHVIVYNWERVPAVDVDLSAAGLSVGAAYEIRDVRNLNGPPLVSDTYVGRDVQIPLVGLTATSMVGWSPAPAHTAPEFAVFLVTPRHTQRSLLSTVVAAFKALLRT